MKKKIKDGGYWADDWLNWGFSSIYGLTAFWRYIADILWTWQVFFSCFVTWLLAAINLNVVFKLFFWIFFSAFAWLEEFWLWFCDWAIVCYTRMFLTFSWFFFRFSFGLNNLCDLIFFLISWLSYWLLNLNFDKKRLFFSFSLDWKNNIFVVMWNMLFAAKLFWEMGLWFVLFGC